MSVLATHIAHRIARTVSNETSEETESEQRHQYRGRCPRASPLVINLNQWQASSRCKHGIEINDRKHAGTSEWKRSEQAHEQGIHDDFGDVLPGIWNLLAKMGSRVATKKSVDSIADAKYECEPIIGPAGPV